VFGADDLAGNVWEITTSIFDTTRHVLRGGGYPLDDQVAASAIREEVHETVRDASIGVRVCADLPGDAG
jgi:formylglycine-generating enzyme required for sulfatase activity